MADERLFFKEKENKICRHNSINHCEEAQCWYAKHLTYKCLHALHGKHRHAGCRGDYLIGYTGKNGAALYGNCECLCHKNKYYSPLSGRWK